MIDTKEARAALIDSKERRNQKIARILVWLTAPVLVATIVFAWIFYAEPYNFITEYISALGHIHSFDDGYINTTSRIIMTTGFSIQALLSLSIAIFYFIRPVLRFNYLKGSLYVLTGLGAAGIAIPGDHDTLSLFHTIGAIMFIFSFAMVNFVHQLLRFLRKHDFSFRKKPFDFYIDLIIAFVVFSVMIIFGVLFALDRTVGGPSSPVFAAPLWQKILVIVDLIAIFMLDLEDM